MTTDIIEINKLSHDIDNMLNIIESYNLEENSNLEQKEFNKSMMLNQFNFIQSTSYFYRIKREEMFYRYDNFLHVDIFIMNASYFLANMNIDKFYQYQSSFKFMKLFKYTYLPYLLQTNIAPENIIIARNFVISPFKVNEFSDIRSLKSIKSLKIKQNHLVSQDQLRLFSQIRNSLVVKEAICEFATQSLSLPNPAFTSVSDAQDKFDYAFNHILTQNKTYFSKIYNDNHGLTIGNYIFINKTFNKAYCPYYGGIILKILLHETAHLAKRISPEGIIKNFSHPLMSICTEN